MESIIVPEVIYECDCSPGARIQIKGVRQWLRSSRQGLYLVAICRRDFGFRGHPAEAHGNRPWGRWRLAERVPGERMLRRNARSKNWQQFRFFMSDPALPAMGIILKEVCVLVTAAFALTLLPGFRQPERSLLSRHDQGTALVVFMILGLVEEMTISHAGWFNERIVTVCAAGLVDRQRVCHLVSGRGPRSAARLHRNCHVVWWVNRRVV